METSKRPFAWHVLHALLIQLLLILFTACGSPPEMFFAACVYCSVGFWIGVLFIIARRRRSPTEGDLRYVKWGLLPIGFIGMFAALLYWSAVGP